MERTYEIVKKELEAARKSARNWNNLQNEGAEGYNPFDATIEALSGELESAEWTAEVTAARRDAWNARVRGGEFTDPRTGKADMRKVNMATIAQGWNMSDLKRHITRHGL